MGENISNRIISVIIPVYNSKKYLSECLNSIINQTYKDLEIIIIDDGSTDGSGEIIGNFSVFDSRVKVITKCNKGLVAARKEGIEAASGDYISFVDSDDYIDLNTYESIINEMNNGSPDMVLYGLVEEYSDYRVEKYNHIKCGWYSENEIKNEIIPNMLSCGDFFDFGVLPNVVCKLVKRKFVIDNLYDVDQRITIGEDVSHTYQLISLAREILVLDYSPYHYCKRYDSMMWKEVEWESIARLESFLRKSLMRLNFDQCIEPQINEYILFVTLLKTPNVILDHAIPFSLEENNIALYGAGGMGQAIYVKYKEKIKVWVDLNFHRYNQSIPMVENIYSLKKNIDKYDSIFIAILNTSICHNVSKELHSMGIDKKIFFYDGKSCRCICC